MKSNADKYYGITFLACARHKNFWGKWARQRNQTATVFLIVTSWTCSTLLAQQTSCEWRLPLEDTGQSFKENLFRQCDSRNLNLNPLCMLKPGSLPALWTERVLTDTIHSKDHFWYSDNFLFSFAGKADLQNIWQLNSLLHLHIGQPNEKEAQGQSACCWVNGKSLSATAVFNQLKLQG